MSSIARTKKVITLALITAVAALGSASATAETEWQKNHPRRTQVNKRLNKQNKRIRQERKEGEITKGQAAAMHKEDRQIRGEERAMASQNGGHITKQEQATLNQQENAVSKQIGK